ncbi:MAG: hypothetical protein WBB25_04355 [Sulfitobacter sp.]
MATLLSIFVRIAGQSDASEREKSTKRSERVTREEIQLLFGYALYKQD